MSQGCAGSGPDSSKMCKRPPLVQLYLEALRISLTISLQKTKTGTGAGRWLEPKHVSLTHIFQLQMASLVRRVTKKRACSGRRKTAAMVTMHGTEKSALPAGNSPSWSSPHLDATLGRVLPLVTPLRRTEAQHVLPLRGDGGCFEGLVLAPAVQLSLRMERGRAELVLVLIWGGFFCFVINNS